MALNFFIKIFIILFLISVIFSSAFSQNQKSIEVYFKPIKSKIGSTYTHYQPIFPLEVGIQVGTSQFLGDLGGQLGKGKGFILDTDIESIRSTFGIFGRYNIGGHFAARLDLSYLQLHGDDKLAGAGFVATNSTNDVDNAWFRYYRNLSFRTHVFEASIVAEIIPYNFELGGGYKNYSVISPYGFIGVGIFAFNPEALYNGNWIELKPLSTEGQGLVDGRALYDLVQLNIPMGLGIKWSYNDNWSVALEINHRMTFTDYIDDVSGDYVIDESIFDNYFSPTIAALAKVMARRSVEIDPNGINKSVTAPGGKRGNPSANDSYYTITVRFSFFLDTGGGRRYGGPVW